jgi:hypothetical protein
MGKRLIKISHWSLKSLLLLYGKAITLLFALFCVASGQIIRTSSANGTIKSRVLFASDSKPLKNIKLYLCNVMYPVYGMSSVPYFVKKDSTNSDSSGYFNLSDTINTCNYNIATEINTSGLVTSFYVSRGVYCPKGKDTTITLYMEPKTTTDVKNQFSNITPQEHYTIQGQTVTLRSPEWVGDNKSASIIDVNGKTVAHLQALTNGEIEWNTESVAKGIYFLDIGNIKNSTTLKILVK